jgi:triosephosphate isomerase (TIM)
MVSRAGKLLVGVNLKMYMDREQTFSWLDTAVSGLGSINSDDVELFLLPSAPLISECVEKSSGSLLAIGAQNISAHDSGAFTGEISPLLLGQMGCEYALIGHHERRTLFGESNEVISQKIAASSRNNLIPVVCIGELSKEEKSAQVEVKTQIRSAVKEQRNLKKLVIAYEPTWAIGVEHPASAEHINKMCALIRTELEDMNIQDFQILYGGSAGEGLFEMISQTCDGLFLGRRSHNPQTYISIVQECISIKAANL